MRVPNTAIRPRATASGVVLLIATLPIIMIALMVAGIFTMWHLVRTILARRT